MGILSERLALPPASPRPCFFKFHVPIVRDCLYFASSLPSSLPWQPGRRFIPRLSRFEASLPLLLLLPSTFTPTFTPTTRVLTVSVFRNRIIDLNRSSSPTRLSFNRNTEGIYIYICTYIYRVDDDTLNTRDARKQDESAANDAIRAGAIQRRVYRVTFPSLISPPNESNESS